MANKIRCRCCNRILDKKYFGSAYIREDNSAKFCKTCNWINIHGEQNISGFKNDDIIKTLDYLLDENNQYINELTNILSVDLSDVIRLVKALNIGGKKKRQVLSKCSCCGKNISSPLNVYETTKNLYCSPECYYKDKTNRIPHGEDSPYYNRIKTNCTNCGKSIKIIPYANKIENSFGENHNFCSKECYWEFRSKYYCNDKSPMKNKIYTNEQKEHLRQGAVKRCKASDFLNSKPQLKVNNILDKLNIEYEREFNATYYSIDNYLKETNLMIEVMGDYWHVNPIKYNYDNKINEIQANGIMKDKRKHNYIKNNYGIEILYLWESDIENNPLLCEKLISLYILGKLDNYHSFNYHINDNNYIEINNTLITPYQDLKIDEYKNIIKKKAG